MLTHTRPIYIDNPPPPPKKKINEKLVECQNRTSEGGGGGGGYLQSLGVVASKGTSNESWNVRKTQVFYASVNVPIQNFILGHYFTHLHVWCVS